MRHGVLCTVAVLGISLAQCASASASTLCVPSTSIPGCPASGANEPTIQDAVMNAASSGDTILIGPDSANNHQPFKESVDDMGKSLTFLGAGPTKTVIRAQGSPGMNISSGSRVFDLGIEVYPAGGNTGLNLAGSATDVAITAQAGVTYATGVDLVSGGAFRHGTVSLPINISEQTGYGGVIGSGAVSDSAISAPVGVGDDALGNTPRVVRDRIRASEGVLAGVNSPVVEDSLIRTVGGPNTEFGVDSAPNAIFGNFTIRHTTIVGSSSSGSIGVAAKADGAVAPATTSVLIDSTIVRGYVNSIAASANPSPFPASTTVTVRHSFYNPATSLATTGATIHRDSHSGNFNPLFISPAADDFQLRAGSPAIDAGSPKLENGESTTDLLGHPRRIVGRKGDAAVGDVGAYEFRPHAPVVHATASKSKIALGKAIRFQAIATDASPGDALSFRWNFGGGSSASGATVNHAFHTSGKHKISVTVTDLDRFTAAATVVVTVQKHR